jgi:hypothetical protein
MFAVAKISDPYIDGLRLILRHCTALVEGEVLEKRVFEPVL